MSQRINYLTFEASTTLATGRYVLNDHPTPRVGLDGAEKLAGLSEMWFNPEDPDQYASIHSNPPGRETVYTGLSVHSFGQGRCIYLAPDLLHLQQDAQQAFGSWLLGKFAPSVKIVKTNAPAAVEITLLQSRTTECLLVGLVNYQKELPNVPVFQLQLDLCLDNLDPKACMLVSKAENLPFTHHAGTIHFEIPKLETIEMVEIRF